MSFCLFCLFVFLSFCLFVFLSFCIFVFLSFCHDITPIKCNNGLKSQKSLFVSKFKSGGQSLTKGRNRAASARAAKKNNSGLGTSEKFVLPNGCLAKDQNKKEHFFGTLPKKSYLVRKVFSTARCSCATSSGNSVLRYIHPIQSNPIHPIRHLGLSVRNCSM